MYHFCSYYRTRDIKDFVFSFLANWCKKVVRQGKAWMLLSLILMGFGGSCWGAEVFSAGLRGWIATEGLGAFRKVLPLLLV